MGAMAVVALLARWPRCGSARCATSSTHPLRAAPLLCHCARRRGVQGGRTPCSSCNTRIVTNIDIANRARAARPTQDEVRGSPRPRSGCSDCRPPVTATGSAERARRRERASPSPAVGRRRSTAARATDTGCGPVDAGGTRADRRRGTQRRDQTRPVQDGDDRRLGGRRGGWAGRRCRAGCSICRAHAPSASARSRAVGGRGCDRPRAPRSSPRPGWRVRRAAPHRLRAAGPDRGPGCRRCSG